MHSHDEDHGCCEHAEFDHQDDTADSDFNFEASHDCDLCDVLMALTDQYLSSDQATAFTLNRYSSSKTLSAKDFIVEDITNTTRGRAPPSVKACFSDTI
jgi:hypothetical protein